MMNHIQSTRTNSPYKISIVKHQYNKSNEINQSAQMNNSQIIESLYSPLENNNNQVASTSLYTKIRVTPFSAAKNKRKQPINPNSSLDNHILTSNFRFSSEADLSYSIQQYQKNEDNSQFHKLSSLKSNNNNNTRKFVLKKIDLQKLNNLNTQISSQQYSQQHNNQNSCSPTLESLNKNNTNRENEIRSSIKALPKIKKTKKIINSSQTTDLSDEIDIQQDHIQQQQQQQSKILHPFSNHSLLHNQNKIKSNRPSDDIIDSSDNDSEEEYNIWNNNNEVLMRGIDFNNFTDSNYQSYQPQVLYKVRSVFYNQFQQNNNNSNQINYYSNNNNNTGSINNNQSNNNNNINNNHLNDLQNNIIKRQNLIKQQQQSQNISQYKDQIEYIPNDKKIQQDFMILKEFANFNQRKNNRRNGNESRQTSPKKQKKNHFIVQMEREKFFQNIQIYQNIQQTPQYQIFQQYYNKYRKTEMQKQRIGIYCRYQMNSQINVDTSHSYNNKRHKSTSSTQGTPRDFKSVNRNNHNNNIQNNKNQSNFSQFINIENQSFSPLIQPEKNEEIINKNRSESKNRKRINTNSYNLYKYINQSSFIKNDLLTNPRNNILKKNTHHSIFDNVVIQAKQ